MTVRFVAAARVGDSTAPLNWRVEGVNTMIADSGCQVAPPSDQPVVEPGGQRASNGPRFARFAAAMEAALTPQDQLLERSPRSRRRARLSAVAAATLPPLKDARSHTADPVRSPAAIRWLGIGSWALFCAALFVSLLLRPDRDAGTGLRPDRVQHQAIVSDVRPAADPTPMMRELLSSNGQAVTSAAPAARADPRASPAPQPTAEASLEDADPPAKDGDGQVLESLALPRLKPPINRVTATVPAPDAEN
jgi:hypothetical protein